MAERKKGVKRKLPGASRSGAGPQEASPRAHGRTLNNPADRHRVESSLPPYTPLVVVKFRDNVQLPYEDIDLVEQYPQRYLRFWQELESQFPDITIRRRITSVTAQQLVDIVKEARKLDQTYCHPANLFLTYFALFCPLGIDPRAVVKALRAPMWVKEVELAYVEGRYSLPAARPGTTSESMNLTNQMYLGPAPHGIDAQYAWTFPGGDGGGSAVGLRFLDIEQGWKLDHRDLPTGIQRIYGSNQGPTNHGTAVLGIVLGVPNGEDCVGITPNVATTKVASWVPAGSSLGFDQDLVNAIGAAIDPAVLGFGDVLLLEVQKTAYLGYNGGPGRYTGWNNNGYIVPVEVEPLVFQQIRNATARNIVVVEAAGNGGLDLDAYTHDDWFYATGQLVQQLNRASYPSQNAYDPFDSRAILVGAATSVVPHAPMTMGTPPQKLHNYGSRIDCYAWGEAIYTTGVNIDDGIDADDIVIFNDTSGAAAIIAGAALAIQGIAQFNGKGDLPSGRFSPFALRDILRNQSTGTPSPTPSTDKIRAMPNLRAILNQTLGIWHHPRHDELIDPLPETFLRNGPPDPGPRHDGSESRIALESKTNVHRASKNARPTKGGKK